MRLKETDGKTLSGRNRLGWCSVFGVRTSLIAFGGERDVVDLLFLKLQQLPADQGLLDGIMEGDIVRNTPFQ